MENDKIAAARELAMHKRNVTTWTLMVVHVLLAFCYVILTMKFLFNLNWLIAIELNERISFWISFIGVTPLLALCLSKDFLEKIQEKGVLIAELLFQALVFNGISVFTFSTDSLGFFFLIMSALALFIIITEIDSLIKRIS